MPKSVKAGAGVTVETHARSLLKAISWRVIASVTTMALILLFTGQLLLATGIGVLEAISKLVLYFFHERVWGLLGFGLRPGPKSRHVHGHPSLVSERERMEATGTPPLTIWLTGLSGSGKTTLAYGLERRLFERGFRVSVLDGENLRLGLSSDLGFTEEERSENVRRAAEAAKLLNQAGVISVCGLISPYREDRRRARAIIGADRFLEIALEAGPDSLADRARGDLYERAERGEIKHFSGITAPYERPRAPDLLLRTDELTVDECLDRLETLVAGHSGDTAESPVLERMEASPS